MNFLAAYKTDVGIKKKTNQDSICIKIANTHIGKIAFCVVCDGMGGLEKGELASAVVIKAFAEWFEKDLPLLFQKELLSFENIKKQWNELIINQNKKLETYGNNNNLKLGTTLTAFLTIEEDYYVAHVGDSRAYEISDEVLQLTHDHTVIAKEVMLGNITQEQAANYPKKNILLQCIGASENVEPEFIKGKIKNNCTYMLCSDGFVHKVSNEEIFGNFNNNILYDLEEMDKRAEHMINLCKSRLEQDNISVVLLKCFEN